MREQQNINEKENKDIIAGRNPVMEAVKAHRAIETVMVSKGELSGSVKVIIALAKEQNIPIKEVDSRKLDAMCGGASHQGIVAIAAAKAYSTVEDMFKLAEEKGEPPFLIILDGIEDPHNLGAIIRTAECAGAHGVIVPMRRAVGLTYIVGKASAGAYEYMPVARVTNLAHLIDELKEKGFWIYGADMDGQSYCSANLKGAAALVIGSEGRGLSRLVREKCDVVLSLPMCGKITSLNASVAAGVLMYEFTRQRLGLKAN
ncbi:MAG: 23S rRNA (guanosine(2251)-2'-O)-methyltransferase RlmB [Acutalibacteraceae bacterium]